MSHCTGLKYNADGSINVCPRAKACARRKEHEPDKHDKQSCFISTPRGEVRFN